MPKLTKVYDITKKHRSIDPELRRASLTQFFKTAPEYVHIPKSKDVLLLADPLDYILTDEDGNLIKL